MVDTDESGEESLKELSGSIDMSLSMSAEATVMYTSGFPKKQLTYAQSARDKAGKIEVIFGGDDVLMVPDEENREHQHNVISAVVNSLGFLEGQKY